MVANATVTFNVIARSILIECFVGYRISGGEHQGYISATVHCNADDSWNAISPCTRTSYWSLVAGRRGLVVGRPTAVREDPGSSLTAADRVYHDSHCDIQPWARVVHLYCSAPRSTQPSTLRGTVK